MPTSTVQRFGGEHQKTSADRRSVQPNGNGRCKSETTGKQPVPEETISVLSKALDPFGVASEQLRRMPLEHLNAFDLPPEVSSDVSKHLSDIFRLAELTFRSAQMWHYEKEDLWLARVRSNSISLTAASPSPTVAFRDLWVQFFDYLHDSRHDPDRIGVAIEELESQEKQGNSHRDEPASAEADSKPSNNAGWESIEHCGRFVARVSPELHGRLSVLAEKQNLPLSDFCVQLIEEETPDLDRWLHEGKGRRPRSEIKSFIKERDKKLASEMPCLSSDPTSRAKTGEFNLDVGYGLAMKLLSTAAFAKEKSDNQPVTVANILRFLLHQGVAHRLKESL